MDLLLLGEVGPGPALSYGDTVLRLCGGEAGLGTGLNSSCSTDVRGWLGGV